MSERLYTLVPLRLPPYGGQRSPAAAFTAWHGAKPCLGPGLYAPAASSAVVALQSARVVPWWPLGFWISECRWEMIAPLAPPARVAPAPVAYRVFSGKASTGAVDAGGTDVAAPHGGDGADTARCAADAGHPCIR